MVEFRVLGPLEILSDGRTVELAGTRTRAVLAVLLLHANRPVSMDRLIDDLWGSSPPPRARGMVHNAVSAIRRAIDGGDDAPRLVRSPAGYQMRVAVDELDLSRFERLVAAAEERLSAGDSDGARARAEEAIGLWRGEALAEFAFEPFASPAVGRLEELRALAEELRVSALAESGGAAEAVADLRSLVAARPWSERLRYLLALALYRSGRQADALAE
ncbi:MAG TPA: BTAD domain-containing putative transcriptional regulator, partial [Gaiellales bacterium]|nr:BTAD domain-containing putative transcriptional regulator [Gaiellales bacterium]